MSCTAYVNTGDLGEVSAAIRDVFSKSGWTETQGGGPTLKLIAAESWTAIETSPDDELLASRAVEGGETLLQALCRRLGCGGFLFCVYNVAESVLLEADAAGNTRITGFRDSDDGDESFHDLPFENPSIVAFELNDLEVDVLDFDDMPQLAAWLHEQLIGSQSGTHSLFFAAP